MYGVIQRGDHKARTCVVKWIKLNAPGDDVEVRERVCLTHTARLTCLLSLPLSLLCCIAQVIGEEEDVSVYDISDHPDFHYHTTDIVIRIGNSGSEEFNDEVKHLPYLLP